VPLIPNAGRPAQEAPASPPELEILEPVAMVHRLAGKYLGGDGRRALVYVETGNGKAEVQSRPLASAIPQADAKAKDDVKRIELPAGKAAGFEGRAFLVTPREFLVIDADCRIDWRFSLPGKPDSGEELVGVAAFYDGKVLLASRQGPQPGDKGEPLPGRFYTLEIATGRQVGFATVPGGFGPETQFAFNAPAKVLYSLSNRNILAYGFDDLHQLWKAELAAPVAFPAAGTSGLIATLPTGVGVIHEGGFARFLPDAAGTAPAAEVFAKNREHVFIPARSKAGEYSLSAFESTGVPHPALKWELPLKQPITTRPVLRGTSVYFVAGGVLHRVNAATGAVCWKQTLALRPGEELTELVFVGDELRASGPGVLVRVADRGEPPAPKPAASEVP
jgi:hypothetical protein